MSEWMKEKKISARKLISYEQYVYYILNEKLKKKTAMNASLRVKHKSDQLKISKQEKANIISFPPLAFPLSSSALSLFFALICYLLLPDPRLLTLTEPSAQFSVDGIS